ncbi:MAG TPA: hypothetical protein VI357_22950 [Mycobacteriales bacterium]
MPNPSGGRLAELTRTAVVRAAALAGRAGPAPVDAGTLASLLYRAGGAVPDPRLDPRWPRHAVLRAERAVPCGLGDWVPSSTDHWLGRTAAGIDPDTLVHKVYVSPRVAALADALQILLPLAVALRVPAWKVGADVAGVHRADKVVLYLASAADADRVATATAAALDGMAAQGVPFTGQVGRTGVVSRGRDVGGTSWRAVICRAVADALRVARVGLGPDAGAGTVAAAALARVAAAGHDVRTWHPGADPRPAVHP